MNTLQIKGNWAVVKQNLKEKYGKLTDEDLRYMEGKEEQLVSRLQLRMGWTRQQAENALDECSRAVWGAQSQR